MPTETVAGHQSQADLPELLQALPAVKVLEALPAAAYICDPDGLIVYFNQRAAEVWGREPGLNDPQDRFCGSFRLYAPDGSSVPHDHCWMALALQQNHNFNGCEIVIERPDGTRVTGLAHVTPVRDEQGNLTAAVNIVVDITERKAAEEACANLVAIVSSSQDAIISKTLDGVITSWNRGAELLYGYTAEEIVGRPVSLLVPPDRPDEIPAILACIRRGERVEGYETVRIAKDGHRVDVWLTVSPVHTPDGRLIGASAIAHDITERKWLEDCQRVLAAVGATLSASLENPANLDPVARLVVPTLADRCLVALRQDNGDLDPVAAAGSGADDEEAARDPYPYSPITEGLSAIERVISTGLSELYPLIESRPPGFENISAMIVPLPARGQILGAMAFARNSFGRRYTAQDLLLAEEMGRRCALAIENGHLYGEAQAALRLRNEVLASVAHDLKNPLAGMSMLAQVIALQLERGRDVTPEKLTAAFRSIHERAGDMASQLDELLDVAALEGGHPLDLQRRPTDLVTLARRVAADTADRHEIRVLAESGELTGEWDELRLQRVLRNLLDNAAKYSPEGGPITVSVTREQEADLGWAILTIDDEGIGIPASDLPTIFDRFHRGGNASGRIHGTGLGLAAVRQIVEQHGGTIAIESPEGVGTTVTVRLPLLPTTARTPAAETQSWDRHATRREGWVAPGARLANASPQNISQ